MLWRQVQESRAELIREDVQMKKKLAALVAGGALIMSVACAKTDAGVTTMVKTKLAADETVKAYQIDVSTQNHIVTLKGDVETSAAKDRAIEIARNTEGVTDVIDQLRVNEAAATSGALLDRDIDAAQEAGRKAADKAEDIGQKTVEKTKEIGHETADKTKDIAKKTGEVVTDAAITSAVKTKFVADTTVKALKIDVDTNNGVVTLNGTVSSRAEADRAVMLARNTRGVTRVVNNLKVG
jgi:osmotically-inducible protein OsmY